MPSFLNLSLNFCFELKKLGQKTIIITMFSFILCSFFGFIIYYGFSFVKIMLCVLSQNTMFDSLATFSCNPFLHTI